MRQTRTRSRVAWHTPNSSPPHAILPAVRPPYPTRVHDAAVAHVAARARCSTPGYPRAHDAAVRAYNRDSSFPVAHRLAPRSVMAHDNGNSNDRHSRRPVSFMRTATPASARHDGPDRHFCFPRRAAEVTRSRDESTAVTSTASPPTSPAAPATRRSLTYNALRGFNDALAQWLRALTCAASDHSSADTARLPRRNGRAASRTTRR